MCAKVVCPKKQKNNRQKECRLAAKSSVAVAKIKLADYQECMWRILEQQQQQ